MRQQNGVLPMFFQSGRVLLVVVPHIVSAEWAKDIKPMQRPDAQEPLIEAFNPQHLLEGWVVCDAEESPVCVCASVCIRSWFAFQIMFQQTHTLAHTHTGSTGGI